MTRSGLCWLFNLNGEANTIRKNESSAIIADDALGDLVTQSIRMGFSIHTGGERVLYIIYQEDRDDGAEIRAANKDAHFAYLEQHRDILVLGGALIADDGIGRIGSCLILNVPGRAQAEAFSRDEPFRKAGLFKSVKITRMRRGQWNPAAAPKTAEGN